jgi:hypothetical protein
LGFGRAAVARLGLLVLLTALVWIAYVPVHELLHVAGCLVSGGSVERLEIAPLYGGHFLQSIFPFVVAGGDYAGRLSGFHPGSDWGYLLTDLAPYTLTLVGSVSLLRLSRRSRNLLLFAVGVVLTAAPAISLPGDYYEMGSILVSQMLGLVMGFSFESGLNNLRHDDLLALLSEFGSKFPENRLGWAAAVLASLAAGWILAGATLALSLAIAGTFLRKPAPSSS